MRVELQELAQLRLERGWSYQRLANDMGLREATLRRALTARHPRMYETTAFAIRRYLERQRRVAEAV